jgi:hypothetical protein
MISIELPATAKARQRPAGYSHDPKQDSRHRREEQASERRRRTSKLSAGNDETPAGNPRGRQSLTFVSSLCELTVVEVPGIEPGSLQDLSVLLRA